MNQTETTKKEKKKILIIDDEEYFTKLMKWNLEETGKYEVRVENRGAGALQAAKKFKPNLIFLDLMMPGIDGAEVSNRLADDRETENIPVVILTAMARKSEEKTGFIAGHSFIAKPMTLKEILDCLAKYGL
jgi:two-component system sensor histidine kinase/response regulator